MKETPKKNIELNIAIGISIVLLISVLFIFTGRKKDQQAAVKETSLSIIKEKSRVTEESDFFESGFEPTTRETKKEPDEIMREEEPEVTLLKDLPLDSLSEDQPLLREKENQETTEPLFKTQPTIENVKKLREKGLIIY